ncbi:hypothetical protein H8F23_16075 [Pseudomonas sp. P155]|uniref:Uncharacterized protein n=1 Tax=Pseudomonas neuropathica TaxID=2730425 RepID=A0ABS0BMU9_9PSED|nr:hypothetical protein [Pseudomonas neuropathica]MBF6034767.1 hypothetical protein [Pseudomonas neuropathica]
MNDLVTPSKHRTSVAQPSGSTKRVAPIILSITNGDDISIPPDGTTTNGDLSFVGSAAPNQLAVMLDYGIPAHPSVTVDERGHFSALLLDQAPGNHAYSVRTSDGQLSAPWTVKVDVSETVSIDSVYDPAGRLVGKGETTFQNELNFIGKGAPGKVVELVNNGTVLSLLNVGTDGHWSAKIKDLKTGTQNFIARETNGQQSSPWRVLIKQPAPISIQFVLGNESFQLIGNQETTSDRSVTLVGTATPGETGWIVDYQRDLVPFAANEHGVYCATIEDLEENWVHTFRLRSDLGRLSTPWAIRVVSSKLR